MKNSLIFALTIVGTIIGAGFATGQELYSFFVIRSESGYLYFFFSAVFIISVSLIIFLYCKNNNINNLETLLNSFFGKKISLIFLFISTLFLFACFCVTASGTGSLFFENLKLPYFVGVMTILVITYATLQFDISGIFFVNALVTPVIIISIIVLGMMSSFDGKSVFSNFSLVKEVSLPVSNALMYFGYNILSVIPIILSADKKISKKSVITGLVISFVIIILTGITILFSLYNTDLNLGLLSLPFLNIVSEISPLAEKLYILIMYFAMITTAISCFYGFYYNLSEFFNISENITVISGLLVAYSVTFFGFTSLVRKVYSLFGIFGIIISFSLVYEIVNNILVKNYKKLIKKE